MEAIFLAGIKEWELNSKNKSSNLFDVKVLEQRLERTMVSSLNKEMETIEKNINFLSNNWIFCTFYRSFRNSLGNNE